MRALYPEIEGYADHERVTAHYEVFGEGNSPTLLLLHGWQVAPSLLWKMQVPYLARRYRVVTADLPGTAMSPWPRGASMAELFPSIGPLVLAVLDAAGVDRYIHVGNSGGAMFGLLVAAAAPERVDGLILIGCGYPADDSGDFVDACERFDAIRPDDEWGRVNAHYWERDFDGFVEFIWRQIIPEPHSTKAIEDGERWTREGDRDAIAEAARFLGFGTALETLLPQAAALVSCPTLVVHGTDDRMAPLGLGHALVGALDCDALVLDGAGHCPHARNPIRVNLAIRDFVDRIQAPPPTRRTWSRALTRPRRALYISSPIGLGHARRDLAIVNALRDQRPDLAVDWLAQHPVTALLESAGERVHPASALLANESAHIESECGEHDLHAFEALRRMDEILCANFGVLNDVLEDESYDLVIGDEAWEADYYWHENPELKRAAFCWLTDFVGYVPMDTGGEREAALTADYNAEMIEQVARHPRVRDRSIFVGEPDDIVGASFGPDLPLIRDWTEAHFDFAGYITGFDPSRLDRDAIRAELGWEPDERVCVVAVGGSGVGANLLAKVIAAQPYAAKAIDGLRTVVVAGPRIDPASLAGAPGLEVHGYVPDLHRRLAAADLAVVQGGLTTTMELVAARRPFLYFPLANHFEQQVHVRHRLERHRAGRAMDYRTDTDPEVLAGAMAAEIGRDCSGYLPVPVDGAARAAARIAELV